MASRPYSPLIKKIYRGQMKLSTSESQSEISSADSDWNDMQFIAAQLGCTNPDDLVTERFRIDRTKLENMISIQTGDAGMNRAEQFFDEITKETSTYIGWPCRLKLNAKSKKDPHVRIVGKPEDVIKAKNRVIAALDTRGTRVIMKMDVSYTDHSYIIGRGGNNIRRIMEETQTHIHFPDSNRLNADEKSNQVSLCGGARNVENARAMIRASSPIVILFEMPIVAAGYPVPNNDTQYVKEIEELYNVQVIFSTRPKLHSSLVLIKGSEKEFLKVKKATQLLMDRICENITTPTNNVQMQIEISTQHHFIVAGKNSDNLRAIMNSTGTKIMFPDAGDVNIRPIKRTQVTITGSIDGVYSARQQLIGNLPISLILDYPETRVDSDKIAKLMKNLDIFINVRQKTRQSTLCVIIKGVEKFIDKIYEARHQLLGLQTEPAVVAKIPSTYFSTFDSKISINALLSNPPHTPTSPLSPMTPNHPEFSLTNNSGPWNFPIQQNKLVSLCNQLQNMTPSPSSIGSPITPVQYQNHQLPGCSSINSNYLHPNTMFQQQQKLQQQQQQQQHVGNISQQTNTSSNTSGYQSISSSNNSLEQSFINQFPSTTTNVSPDTTSNFFSSYVKGNNNNNNNNNDNSIASGSQEMMNKQHSDSYLYEIDRKKLFGLKQMDLQPVRGEQRIPTPTWSGMSLSRTSPMPTTPEPLNNYHGRENSVFNLGVTTSLLDVTPKQHRRNFSNYPDMHSLLLSMGLEHYIKLFMEHEIDLHVFQSLTDADLQTLGITALGTRRKLLLAAREIATNQSPMLNYQTTYSGSAAPGAERRAPKWW